MSLLSSSVLSINSEQNSLPQTSQILCDVQKPHGGCDIAEHIHSSQQYSHNAI